MSVHVSDLAVANPASSFSQDEMLDLLGLADDPFAQSVFARCGVRSRSLNLTPELLRSTLQQRTARTEDLLLELAISAVDELAIDPAEIGTLITASYWSLGGPTLAHRLLDHYGMDPSTDKYHLTGIGCASAVPLFKVAAQSMRDHPGKHALVVAAESLSGLMTPVGESDERTKTVGSSLFGDGCAAALLSNGASTAGPAVLATSVHQLGGTLDTVRLRHVEDDSFIYIGRELPTIARTQLRALVEDFLATRGAALDDVAHWLAHPGGRGIVDGVQEALELSDEDVAVSRDVLARHGNMGTPSALYVLRETIAQRRPQPGDLGLMTTIGPGVTVGLMLLEW